MSEIGVGLLIGHKFTSGAHSGAHPQGVCYFDVIDPVPRIRVLGGRGEAAVKATTPNTLCCKSYETDYCPKLGRDDIGLADSSGDMYCESAIAALEAGKQVLSEKPLANTRPEAREMLTAAQHGEHHLPQPPPASGGAAHKNLQRRRADRTEHVVRGHARTGYRRLYRFSALGRAGAAGGSGVSRALRVGDFSEVSR